MYSIYGISLLEIGNTVDSTRSFSLVILMALLVAQKSFLRCACAFAEKAKADFAMLGASLVPNPLNLLLTEDPLCLDQQARQQHDSSTVH